MKVLCIINSCCILLLTVWVLLIYTSIDDSVASIEDTKMQVEAVLSQKPDSIIIHNHINNYIKK